MIKVEKELLTAKKASLKSAELLIKQKNVVNDVISNEGRDIKLKADIESESIIKKYLSNHSDLPILAEESGANEDLGSTFWVVDPLDGTSNYSRDDSLSKSKPVAKSNSVTPKSAKTESKVLPK